MTQVAQTLTRFVAITADPLTHQNDDATDMYKRLYVVNETDLLGPLISFDVLNSGLKFWRAYVDSLTAQGRYVCNVVTLATDPEFLFTLSRCLSRSELDLLSEKYPNIYKETT